MFDGLRPVMKLAKHFGLAPMTREIATVRFLIESVLASGSDHFLKHHHSFSAQNLSAVESVTGEKGNRLLSGRVGAKS
jgi:hypothetical protein